MSKILFTTTPTIEGAKITAYYGVVRTSVVLGTNIFADAAAYWNDIFGGRSSTFEHKLDVVYDGVMKNLTAKAQYINRNINAIVGFRIDFDEISGKNTQMFMATAIGTMCTVEYNHEEIAEIMPTTPDTINLEELEVGERTAKIEADLKVSTGLNDENWQFVFTHSLPQLAPRMCEIMKNAAAEYRITFREKFVKYLATLPLEMQKDIVYGKVENSVNQYEAIARLKLFDAKRILEILKGGDFHRSTWLIETSKNTYTMEDVEDMKKLIAAFDNMPDKGQIKEEESKSIFGKSSVKKIYTCPNGHKNDGDKTFCTSTGCGLDIKGRTEGDVNKIENFRRRVEILEKLFEEKK